MSANSFGARATLNAGGKSYEIWVIPTVGCVARTAQKIAERDGTQRGNQGKARASQQKQEKAGRQKESA